MTMKKTILATAAVALGAGLSWAGSSDAMFSNQLGALNVTSPAKALSAQQPSQPNTGVIVPPEKVHTPLTQLSGDALSRLKAKAVEMYRKYGTDKKEDSLFVNNFFQVNGRVLPNGGFDIESVELSRIMGENDYLFTISLLDGSISVDRCTIALGFTLEHPQSQKALRKVLEHYIGSF